jgi:hypothetical protein
MWGDFMQLWLGKAQRSLHDMHMQVQREHTRTPALEGLWSAPQTRRFTASKYPVLLCGKDPVLLYKRQGGPPGQSGLYGKFHPYWDSNPGQSLYRLSYSDRRL